MTTIGKVPTLLGTERNARVALRIFLLRAKVRDFRAADSMRHSRIAVGGGKLEFQLFAILFIIRIISTSDLESRTRTGLGAYPYGGVIVTTRVG